jgi:hypothetical protein
MLQKIFNMLKFIPHLDWEYHGSACNFRTDLITDAKDPYSNENYTKLHPSGWKISGQVRENYYSWVQEIEASHVEYGVVKGDFEKEVFASSQWAFDHFMKNHPPRNWDYGDI